MLSVLSLLGACSHQQMSTTSHPYKVSKSFLDVIKTKKPGKLGADKRFPASSKSIPGLTEFILALKANPAFLKAPVGYEVIKENSGTYEGQEYKDEDKSVYLKQTIDGHFVIENGEDAEAPASFNLYESQRIESLESDLATQDQIKEFKKISATQFVMIFKIPQSQFSGLCQFDIDLTKSSELQGSSCKDEGGKFVSVTKVISVKPINLQDYAEKLKAVKLQVYPNALDCGMVTFEDGGEATCFDSVTDDSEKDWSYLLK